MELVPVVSHRDNVHGYNVLGLWLQISHADLNYWEHPPVTEQYYHSKQKRNLGDRVGIEWGTQCWSKLLHKHVRGDSEVGFSNVGNVTSSPMKHDP